MPPVALRPSAASGNGPELPPAVRAFERTAPAFDTRFGGWRSVAAQRRAVRRHLDAAFHPGDHVLELGGGTGEDALHLGRRGVRVLLTDGSPAMVAYAADKVRRAALDHTIETRPLTLERLEDFALEWSTAGRPLFAGAYSNFAAVNCVPETGTIARALARLLRPGAAALLVIFGPWSIGEIAIQLARGDRRAAFRRFTHGPVPARIAGQEFSVWYHRPRAVVREWHPWFRLEAVRGVGVFVPPSAAEPGISGWPRLLGVLEGLDRVAAAPLAHLGDHVLLRLRRTAEPAP